MSVRSRTCSLLVGLSLVGLLLGGSGCGASQTHTHQPGQQGATPRPQAATQIRREALRRQIPLGLGVFLSHVNVEPDMADGHFRGFRVLALDAEFFGDPCLVQPGDTVIKVNDQTFERPEEAQTVWNSLETANVVEIDVLRGGVQQRVHYDVVD